MWLPLTRPLLDTWPTTLACAVTENQINDLENKEAKHNPPEQEEKRIQERKMGIVQAASGKT